MPEELISAKQPGWRAVERIEQVLNRLIAAGVDRIGLTAVGDLQTGGVEVHSAASGGGGGRRCIEGAAAVVLGLGRIESGREIGCKGGVVVEGLDHVVGGAQAAGDIDRDRLADRIVGDLFRTDGHGVVVDQIDRKTVKRRAVIVRLDDNVFVSARGDQIGLGRAAEDIGKRSGQRELGVERLSDDRAGPNVIRAENAELIGRVAAAGFGDREIAAAGRIERNSQAG